MDKIKLNNQIVSMRKYVKQAKVHVINKLTKEVKLLQNRKGNETKVQKAKRKAERFLEAITLLKKIKSDHVSRLALSKAKNWTEILEQKNATLEDRCLAMLANYGVVQKEVETFYSSNKDLAVKICDLIKQWEERNKDSKNTPKSKRVSNAKEKLEKSNAQSNGSLLKNTENETGSKKTDTSSMSEKGLRKKSLMDDFFTSDDEVDKLTVEPLDNIGAETKNKELGSDAESVEEAKKSNSLDGLEEKAMEFENADVSGKSSESEDDDDDDSENETMSRKSDPTQAKNRNKKSDTEPPRTEAKTKNNKFGSDLENSKETKKPTSSISQIENMESENSDIGDESDDDDNHDSEDDDVEGDSDDDGMKNTKNSNIVEGSTPEKTNLDNNVKEAQQPDIKKINAKTSKHKAIALLNLDELEGLEEIPIDRDVEMDESDDPEEASSEDEATETSQSKRNDPFFLGCGDEASTAEENPRHNYAKAEDSNYSDSNRTFQKDNSFFKRRESSDEYNRKKSFQKFPNTNRDFKRDSGKFQNKRDNFRPYPNGRDQARNYQNKFQSKSNVFDRNNPKNQGDFKMKGRSPQNFRERQNEYKSKNVRDTYPKGSERKKKSNVDDKPLHPSWEAKRKQKETVNTSFQGKRIVFND